MTEQTEEIVDGVTYVTRGRFRWAKCCGHARCTSECKAIIFHGAGHQSKTHCQVKGPHETHRATFGEFRNTATWTGDEVFAGHAFEIEAR